MTAMPTTPADLAIVVLFRDDVFKDEALQKVKKIFPAEKDTANGANMPVNE